MPLALPLLNYSFRGSLLQIATDFQFISPLCAEKVLSVYRAQLQPPSAGET